MTFNGSDEWVVTLEDREQIVLEAHKGGMSFGKIEKEYSIPKSTAQRIWKIHEGKKEAEGDRIK
jgi:hypothetical protein